MHQSIPPAPCSPSPRADPLGIGIFFLPRKANSPGLGILELSNPQGWGGKKKANAPSSVNTAIFFIDRTVEQCHPNVRIFVSTRTRLQRHQVSPAWRLDREMRRRLIEYYVLVEQAICTMASFTTSTRILFAFSFIFKFGNPSEV